MSQIRTKAIIASAIFTALSLGAYQGSTVLGEKYAKHTHLIASQINEVDGISFSLIERDKGFFSINDTYQLAIDGVDGKIQLNAESSLYPWDTNGIIYIDKSSMNHNLFKHLPSISETTLKWNADHDAMLLGDNPSVINFEIKTPDIALVDDAKFNELLGTNDITDGYLSLKGASINGQLSENNANATLKIDELKASATRISSETVGFTLTNLTASDRFHEFESGSLKKKSSDYRGVFALGKLSVEQGGGVIELENAKLITTAQHSESVTAEQKLNIGNVAISYNGIVISKPDIGYHWDLKGLNVDIDDEVIASDKYSERLNIPDRILLSMVEDNFSFNLHKLNLGVASGSMSVTTEPLPDNVKDVDLPLIMQGAKVDAELNVSKSIAALLPISYEVIQAYQEQGFFTSDKDNFNFKVKLESQKLSIGDVEINATH